MEHKNDDTFANLRLLVDTASFLSSMEKLAPLHPSVQFTLGVPLVHDGGPLFMMPKRERSRRPIPKIQRERNTTTTTTTTTTTIGGCVTSLLSDLQRSGASNINLLIQKKIYASDINPNLGRLSIPCKQVKARGFLTVEEEQMLAREAKNGITASLYLPWLNITQEVSFRKWNMNNSFIYSVCGSWSKILKRNIFNKGDVVQVWSFRNNSRKLCLVLVKVN